MTIPDRDRTILLYEDDQALASEIVIAFAADGLHIREVADEDDLALAVGVGAASALVMDRMIGDRDSLVLLERLRAKGERVPIVVISSLSSVDERIHGLKAGGDDYLVKPFAMSELIARVRALRRRAHDDRPSRLYVGPLVMDLIARSVRRGDREIMLVPREFTLLEFLMRNAGHAVTRSMLFENIWSSRVSSDSNVIDVYISNLRRKIDGDGQPALIKSVRGVGFLLSVEALGDDD